MNYNFVHVIKRIVENIYVLLGKLHLAQPVTMVMIDGGFCSQMHQYMIGEILKEKGRRIEYDLSFYKKGLDLNGMPTRLFLLDKLFPSIRVNKASEFKVFLYKLFFRYYGQHPQQEDYTWLVATPPILLSGYYSDIKEMYAKDGYMKSMFKLDASVLTNQNRELYNEIIQSNSVGVHVRRGDLDRYNVAYGNPVSLDYLKEGVLLYQERLVKPIFFFFTDDIDYVKQEMTSFLEENNIEWRISNTDLEHVYEDFVLLSYCKDIISSKGTMGKYAAVLGGAKTIVVSHEDNQKYIVEESACSVIYK